MRKSLGILAAAALLIMVGGCDSEDAGGGGVVEIPGAGGAGGGAGGAGGGTEDGLTGLTFIGFSDADLEVGAELRLAVEAAYADGTTRDVTAEAAWSSSDEAILTVSAGVVTALAVGTASVRVELDAGSASADITVIPAEEVTLDAIDISPENPRLALDGEEQFTATAIYSDGTTEDVTEQAEWAVDDVRVLDLDDGAPGHVQVVAGGPVTVTATLGEVSGEVSTVIRCEGYPRYADVIRFRGIMPPAAWRSAFTPEGEEFEFSFEDLQCFAKYADVGTIAVVFGAGWCPACTRYTQLIDRMYGRLEPAGMRILHVMTQTADFGPASSAYANSHITRLIGDGHGIRVGDLDTWVEGDELPNYFNLLDFIEYLPTTVIVRTRDMKIIADSRDKRRYLPLEEIALDPEADWRDPDRAPIADNCGEGVEEEWEGENDYPNTAPEVGPGTYEGGICNGFADFYRIDVAGRWRARLEFDAAVGDLGMYLWDARQAQPLTQNGQIVGSDGTGSVEEFSFQGAANLLIEGFMNRSTAPYTLTIEAL